MRQLLSAVLLVAALSPAYALAKGEGVGLWMEGQISEVRAEGGTIHLVVTGRFWLDQYHGENASLVEPKKGRIPATVRQGKPFFELVDARLKFGRQGRFSVEAADVLRATDHDLR